MRYQILGLMSGTSLDGLDMALCTFNSQNYAEFCITKSVTAEYPETLANRLKNSLSLNAVEYIKLHKQYATFIANKINELFKEEKIDFIASHGHTSIHYPDQNINFQLGDGATLSALTELPVVCDFRSTDIALGGQGAPLVPGGEKHLFPDFDTFLNIGGFANISFWRNNVFAYDICPANYALNFFALKFGKKYDKNGLIGQKGTVIKPLLDELSGLEYFKMSHPKSLSDHWFFDVFLKTIDKYSNSDNDKLRTIYEFISAEIAKNIDRQQTKKIMITGGGAYNNFLVELIRNKTKAEIYLPEKQIIDYKEALIFAFLGLLRWENKNNCLSDVTGAKHDNIGGAIYLPGKSL